MKEELRNRLEEFKSETNDERFDWKVMGPQIKKGLATQKKKKRRGMFWLFFGIGLFLLMVLATFGWSKFYLSQENVEVENRLERKNTVIGNKRNIEAKNLKNNTTARTKDKQTDNTKVPAIVNKNHSKSTYLKDSIYQQSVSMDSKIKNQNGSTIKTTKDSSKDWDLAQWPKASSEKGLSIVHLLAKESQSRPGLAFPFIPLIEMDTKALMSNLASEPDSMQFVDMAMHMMVEDETILLPKHNFWSVDITFGTAISSIANTHRSSENRWGGQIAAHVEYHSNGSLVFGSGLQYQNLRFQTTAQFTEDAMLYRPNTIDTIYRYNNDNEFYAFTDSIAGMIITEFGHTNQMSIYSIPIFVGYDWEYRRISFGARVGVNAMLRRQLLGRLVSAEGTIVNVNETSTDIDLGHYLKFNFGFHLSDRWSIQANITQNRASLFDTTSDPAASNHISIFGGSAGLRMLF